MGMVIQMDTIRKTVDQRWTRFDDLRREDPELRKLRDKAWEQQQHIDRMNPLSIFLDAAYGHLYQIQQQIEQREQQLWKQLLHEDGIRIEL